ncbi:hypothetical protein Tco_0400526 [Tanacetum coccineum]
MASTENNTSGPVPPRQETVKKSSSPNDNSKQQDTQPTANVQQPTTPTTTVIVEENNTDIQADNVQIDEDEFYNVFSTPVREKAESSSRYVDSQICILSTNLINLNTDGQKITR